MLSETHSSTYKNVQIFRINPKNLIGSLTKLEKQKYKQIENLTFQ
jgi:hypothetical protein